MAASGVIGISAQIVESLDIGGKQKATPDMSLLQRITGSFQNMRKDWKKMVGNKGTGLFYLLLANSKIVQGVIGQVFQMFIALIELMMPIFIPTLVWIIENMSNLLKKIQNMIEMLTEKFKEVFSLAWEAVQTAISAGWTSVEELFGLEKTVDVQHEVDQWQKAAIGTPMTQDEVDFWANAKSGGLILGGPIDPKDWEEPATGEYNKENEIDEGITPPALNWLYDNGPDAPPGGKVSQATVENLIESGDIQILEGGPLSEGDAQEGHDKFFSWTDDIIPFGWTDITDWMGDSLGNIKETVTWEAIFKLLLGTYSKNANSSEEVLKEIIDRGISEEEDVPENPDAYPRADDVHNNPFDYEQEGYWGEPK